MPDSVSPALPFFTQQRVLGERVHGLLPEHERTLRHHWRPPGPLRLPGNRCRSRCITSMTSSCVLRPTPRNFSKRPNLNWSNSVTVWTPSRSSTFISRVLKPSSAICVPGVAVASMASVRTSIAARAIRVRSARWADPRSRRWRSMAGASPRVVEALAVVPVKRRLEEVVELSRRFGSNSSELKVICSSSETRLAALPLRPLARGHFVQGHSHRIQLSAEIVASGFAVFEEGIEVFVRADAQFRGRGAGE